MEHETYLRTLTLGMPGVSIRIWMLDSPGTRKSTPMSCQQHISDIQKLDLCSPVQAGRLKQSERSDMRHEQNALAEKLSSSTYVLKAHACVATLMPCTTM